MHWLSAAALILAGAAGSAARPAAPAGMALPTALLPITAADESGMVENESGCIQSFDQDSRSYLYAVGHVLLMHPASGLQTCAITDAQFGRFGVRPLTLSCGGRQLVLRPVGRSHPRSATDSNGGDATLTMTQGGHTRIVHGSWSVAC